MKNLFKLIPDIVPGQPPPATPPPPPSHSLQSPSKKSPLHSIRKRCNPQISCLQIGKHRQETARETQFTFYANAQKNQIGRSRRRRKQKQNTTVDNVNGKENKITDSATTTTTTLISLVDDFQLTSQHEGDKFQESSPLPWTTGGQEVIHRHT